jgi:hypothetical protein
MKIAKKYASMVKAIPFDFDGASRSSDHALFHCPIQGIVMIAELKTEARKHTSKR